MSDTIRLTLPMPPNYANQRKHWRTVHRERSEYYLLCDAMQAAKQIPAPPERPVTRAVLSTTLYLGAAMDDDNASIRTKWCVDWLKTRGYIADDRTKNLVRTSYPRQVVKRDGNYRVELALTPIEKVTV